MQKFAAALWVSLALSAPAHADWDKYAFELQDADGQTVSSTDLEGKLVFLNVWATWCAPCLPSLPRFQMLYDFNKNNPNVAVLSVHYKTKYGRYETASGFLETEGYNFPVLQDVDGKLTKSIDNIPFATSVPHYVLISPKGKIIKRYENFTNGDIANIQWQFGKHSEKAAAD